MRSLITLAGICFFALFSLAAPATSERALSEKHATEHFELHYRPGSRAGAAVDRTAHLVELEYAEIVRELELKGLVNEKEPFHLYLYDDLEEMEKITGVSGTGGYSAGRESHIPWDNDQTRKHELVHIVVAAMKSTGDEERNMFFAEGIANAVLEYVHGIPVHSVAAYELERGTLPGLKLLVENEDFYAFLRANPGLNAYDVAGSFFLYLLETNKPRKVMEYYHGKPIRKALGKSLAAVEKGWHKHLKSFPIRPALHTLLSQRRGDGGEFTSFSTPEANLPDDLLGKPESWKSLLGSLEPEDEVGTWKSSGGKLSGDNPSGSDWSHVSASGNPRGDCVLRMRAKIGAECWGVKIRYGPNCEAMLLGAGAFIYTEQGGIAHTDRVRVYKNEELDLIMRVRDGHVEVFVNEALVLEADLKLEPSPVGLGLVGGQATITSFEVRDL